MRIVILVLGIMFIALPAHAVNYVVTLTAEQDKAMQVLEVVPGLWIQNAATNKANQLIDSIVRDNSDKQPNKMTSTEKNTIINSVDISKQRRGRGR